ncbi:hypothetical protein R6Q57_001736 [Mikania cordata]
MIILNDVVFYIIWWDVSLFTLPPHSRYGLISWFTVVDVCKDGGILKRVVKKGEQTWQPGDLDEVIVSYVVMLVDSVTITDSQEGVEFYLKDDDAKVVKKILKVGEGSLTANEGASVTVRFTGMLEDATIFEIKDYDGETLLCFITDEEQVINGLDRAAATMKNEEHAILTISHEYGY